VSKKTPKPNEAPDAPRYEELIDELETIVDRIESGEVGLEESIKGYEAGIKLVTRARAILDQAEQRIVELNTDQLGTGKDTDA